jgi:L-galactose dehydrogenase/L-glyceraldehyde 3-phosphate reductase
MEYRPLGRTGLSVSALGFGCGNVGGLLLRGAPAERRAAVARALELGINYFDTAPSYGAGQSETTLGAILRELSATPYVGTKFALRPEDRRDVRAAITRSLEASLRRLARDHVDLFQLHDDVGGQPGWVTAREALDEVVPVLESLRQQGLIRFWGLTAKGDSTALHEVVGSGRYHSAQVFCNLLNPSAAVPVPPGFPAQDFGGLATRAGERGLGVIVVRALAGGALSGSADRHPVASPAVDPIASGPDYAVDVGRARALGALVREGHVESLVEAALRFPLGTPAVSTVLLGYSDLAQLELAASAVARGPLPAAARSRLAEIWRALAAGAPA